jgi:hypothetical protein
MTKKPMKMNIDNIPLDSSLGLLAYGHLAFTAWRKIKKEHKKKRDEEK